MVHNQYFTARVPFLNIQMHLNKHEEKEKRVTKFQTNETK